MKRIWNMIPVLKEKYKSMNVAVKASLWFALCSIIQKGISVITLPIFTRLMSTQQYGEYSIFLTWYNILTIITTLNIQLDIFNKGLIDHSEEKEEFTANQAGLLVSLTAIFGIIYFIFRGSIDSLLGLSTGLVLVMLLEILGNAIIALWSARKRFSFEYSKIVKVTLTTSFLNPIIGIIAVMATTQKAEARIISSALIAIIVAIILLFRIARKGKLFGNFKWWKVAIISSLPLLPHYLSLVLLNQSDKLMINHFVDAEKAAIYSVAHSAGLLMTIINTSINGSFVPWVYNKIKIDEKQGIKRVTNMLMAIVLLTNLLVIWLAPEVVRILAAPQYAVAIWCLAPIAMSVFFFFVYTLFVDIEIYYGVNNYIAIASVIAAALNIVLNYIFIPKFGYIAAGYTTLVSYFATMITHYYFLKRVLKKSGIEQDLFDVRVVVLMSLLLCLCSAGALYLYNYTWLRIGIVILAVTIVLIKRSVIIALFKEIKKKK